MPLVEITEAQQKLLDKHEFEKLVSERSDLVHEAMVLEEAQKFRYRQSDILEELWFAAQLRRAGVQEIDEKLTDMRKKLGIETPTIHTEL